jgi:hypothetical protein
MYLNYTKVLTSISLLFVAIVAALVPAYMTLSIIVLSASFIGLHYVLQNYDIDYKYWFSFIGQLFALILIVSGFVAIFGLFVSLITP